MKKFLAVFLVLAAVLTLFAACGKSKNEDEAEEDKTKSETTVKSSSGLQYTLSEDGASYIVTGIGECRVPKSWKLLYKTESGDWKEVPNPSSYDCKTWDWSVTTFDPVTTSGLKIEIESQPNYAGGIHEWTVE